MTTLKGIFPDSRPTKGKNFIHENVKNLRRMEHSHVNKKAEEPQRLLTHSRRRPTNSYGSSGNGRSQTHNIISKGSNLNLQTSTKRNDSNWVNSNMSGRVNQHHHELCKKTSVPMLKKSNGSPKKTIYSATSNLSSKEKKKEHKESHKFAQKLQERVSSDPNLVYKSVENAEGNVKTQIKLRNQGIQTLDTTEIDDIYSEGIVRYPSRKYLNCDEFINEKTEANENFDTSLKNLANSPSDRGDIQIIEKSAQNRTNTKSSKLPSFKEETNFVKLNKEHTCTTNKVPSLTNNNNVLPTNYRMGVIPKYIKTRKEVQEKNQKAKVEDSDPNCPNGHMPLPDSERKETLRMLRKNYQDYVNELNMLPIKVDTLRAQRRKIEIEKQLNKLEEGIKVFSRPKVYVKMNA